MTQETRGISSTAIQQKRDYEKARDVPQPIDVWRVKEHGCGGNPRTWKVLQTDEKRQYPILLTWPLIQGASRYVVQLTGVQGSRPTVSFESETNSLRLGEEDIAPGRYQWGISVHDAHGEFVGDIEPLDPVGIFAIDDPEPVAANGKRVLIDLNHSAGHTKGWGYYNHAQYMTRELLENAGFQVEINERDLLTVDSLKPFDLLICHYYWAGWPDFRPYLESERSAVHEYVANGGSLLVVGCDRNDGGGKMSKAGNELIGMFGFAFALDEIPKNSGNVEIATDQHIISLDTPLFMQLPVGVQGQDAVTLLQFEGVPIAKVKQFGEGKVLLAGVGMSFLDCYLGDLNRRGPVYIVLFYDLIRYLTDIDWKNHCKQEFMDMLS